MNKFFTGDVVKFIQDKKEYKIVRGYKGNDGKYKYDVISMDGKTTIIAMPEEVLELGSVK